MYIVCNVPIVCCMTSYVNMWRVDFERVRSVHTVWCAMCSLHEKNKYFFQWMSDILSHSFFLYRFVKYRITRTQIFKQCTLWKVFYYQRTHFDHLNFMYSTKMQKDNLSFQKSPFHASTVPSLTIALARFLASASLRSSTLVSSVSSSWNDKCTQIRSIMVWL